MLKKARESAAEGKDDTKPGMDSSRSIWLAGLGAFSRAQAEGMRMFENLVKQGEALESKTRQAASDTAAAARGAAKAKVTEVKNGVGGTWDKLEQVFEDRVARALGKLGVYTQNDVQKLADRVEALSAAVHELLNSSGTGAPARAKRTQRPKRPPAARAKAKPATKTAKKSTRK